MDALEELGFPKTGKFREFASMVNDKTEEIGQRARVPFEKKRFS